MVVAITRVPVVMVVGVRTGWRIVMPGVPMPVVAVRAHADGTASANGAGRSSQAGRSSSLPTAGSTGTSEELTTLCAATMTTVPTTSSYCRVLVEAQRRPLVSIPHRGTG
jgi:hypothetical protein